MNVIETIATKNDVRSAVQSLLKDLRNYKRDVVRWMFVFWLGQIGATIAMVILLSNK